MKNLLIAFAALLLVSSVTLLLISSCKKKDDPVAVDGVTISPSAVSVKVDETAKLTASVTPENAADKSLTWNSSDNNIATVEEGTVTGKSIGTATITVTSKSNPSKSAVCAVTVEGGGGGWGVWGGGGGGGVWVEGITPPAAASVTVNATVTLTPVITPADADKSLTWTSNDDHIASVAEGVVTGKSPGTVTITAVSKSNPTKSAACAVTVSAVPVPLTALGVSPASASLLVNGELRLNAVFPPENTTDRAVTWTSSAEAIATVDANGLVKAKTAAGQATVTVKSASDPTKTAACVIAGTATAKPLEGLTVVPAGLPLQVGGARQLEVNVTPADATERRVTFESSDVAKASVSATGAVTALAAGTAVITVTSVSDPTKTARCEVTVTDILVTGITVTSPVAPAAVLEDKTLQLGVVVEPSNAANKELTWTSSDDSRAAVDPNTGMVTGKLKGTVTITAASKDGSNISNTLNLTVTPRARTIAVNPSDPSVRIG